jgi:hypothetical protein
VLGYAVIISHSTARHPPALNQLPVATAQKTSHRNKREERGLSRCWKTVRCRWCIQGFQAVIWRVSIDLREGTLSKTQPEPYSNSPLRLEGSFGINTCSSAPLNPFNFTRQYKPQKTHKGYDHPGSLTRLPIVLLRSSELTARSPPFLLSGACQLLAAVLFPPIRLTPEPTIAGPSGSHLRLVANDENILHPTPHTPSQHRGMYVSSSSRSALVHANCCDCPW